LIYKGEEQAISVIMPAFQPGAFVYEAIDSILNQGYPFLEILFIDDGSKDGTAVAVEALGISNIRVFRKMNGGPGSARNLGLEKATGDIIAFLDADDLWLPGKVELQLQLLRENLDAGIVMGNTEGFGAIADEEQRHFKANWESRQFLQLGALMVRKVVFEQLGGFDTTLRYAEDVDWILRVRQAGVKIFEHSDCVLKYRRHARNMTNDTLSRDMGFIAALRKNIERKRSGE